MSQERPQLIKKAKSLKDRVSLQHMHRLRMQVGFVQSVSLMKKARNPSYEMHLDFGEMGTKVTCGQFVNNYAPSDLLGKQVAGITNFSPRRIAGVKSEALTLGFPDGVESRQAICLQPYEAVPNGVHLNFGSANISEQVADFDYFLALDIRAATVKAIQTFGEYTFAHVDLGEMGEQYAWIPGLTLDGERYVGLQGALWLNPIISIPGHPTIDSIFLVAPVASYDHKATEAYYSGLQNNIGTSLLVTSKRVQNGFALF